MAGPCSNLIYGMHFLRQSLYYSRCRINCCKIILAEAFVSTPFPSAIERWLGDRPDLTYSENEKQKNINGNLLPTIAALLLPLRLCLMHFFMRSFIRFSLCLNLRRNTYKRIDFNTKFMNELNYFYFRIGQKRATEMKMKMENKNNSFSLFLFCSLDSVFFFFLFYLFILYLQEIFYRKQYGMKKTKMKMFYMPIYLYVTQSN